MPFQSEVLFRDKIAAMPDIDMGADALVSALLRLAQTEPVCILDSCGIGNLGSHLLIAGIEPVSIAYLSGKDANTTLDWFDKGVRSGPLASIFTISYDFGKKLHGIDEKKRGNTNLQEPDICLNQFDALIVHDYDTGQTSLRGNRSKFAALETKLNIAVQDKPLDQPHLDAVHFHSDLNRDDYIALVETIKEEIRSGFTYQTNLTQQLLADLPPATSVGAIFHRIRKKHPAPFAAFLKRTNSTVVSASPERFIKVDFPGRLITTSPVKGTRPRGKTSREEASFKAELLASKKDRAENTMIVDLLRNDIGRICKYGSVHVEQLCELETHPTYFHLVSTICGTMRDDISLSDIMRAVFPCGSITGAPKISTMRIIDRLETRLRGLSMGAIGYYVPKDVFGLAEVLDMSVAIRTMVVRDRIATFNVGGGIVIDSDPESEYAESLVKANALLSAVNGRLV